MCRGPDQTRSFSVSRWQVPCLVMAQERVWHSITPLWARDAAHLPRPRRLAPKLPDGEGGKGIF